MYMYEPGFTFCLQVNSHTIKFTYIDPRGIEELGDGDGVARDVLTTFWQEVSDSLLIGEGERVPYVRHDFFEEEWNILGKIIVYGFKKLRYFPILLSRAFVLYCMSFPIKHEVMINSFKSFLSNQEKDLIETAVKDDVDDEFLLSDDFMELLENFKVRTRVTKANVSNVVYEVAQQELFEQFRNHI